MGPGIYFSSSREYAESYAVGGEAYRSHIVEEARNKPRDPHLIKVKVSDQANIIELDELPSDEAQHRVFSELSDTERQAISKRFEAYGPTWEHFTNALAQSVSPERYVEALRSAGVDGFWDFKRDELAILDPEMLELIGSEKLKETIQKAA